MGTQLQKSNNKATNGPQVDGSQVDHNKATRWSQADPKLVISQSQVHHTCVTSK